MQNKMMRSLCVCVCNTWRLAAFCICSMSGTRLSCCNTIPPHAGIFAIVTRRVASIVLFSLLLRHCFLSSYIFYLVFYVDELPTYLHTYITYLLTSPRTKGMHVCTLHIGTSAPFSSFPLFLFSSFYSFPLFLFFSSPSILIKRTTCMTLLPTNQPTNQTPINQHCHSPSTIHH
ncbi:hypothetical protein IWX48DRAFT_626621 [Phyllosticta citricarpa]